MVGNIQRRDNMAFFGIGKKFEVKVGTHVIPFKEEIDAQAFTTTLNSNVELCAQRALRKMNIKTATHQATIITIQKDGSGNVRLVGPHPNIYSWDKVEDMAGVLRRVLL